MGGRNGFLGSERDDPDEARIELNTVGEGRRQEALAAGLGSDGRWRPVTVDGSPVQRSPGVDSHLRWLGCPR